MVVDQLGFAWTKWQQGTSFGPENHADEQINFVLKGKVTFTIKDDAGERTFLATEGTIIGLEAYAFHSGTALEETVIVESHWPATRLRELIQKLGAGDLILAGADEGQAAKQEE